MIDLFCLPKAVVRVPCAIIEQNGLILAAQRSAFLSFPLKWEFPGGKQEKGENDRETLIREIREELNVEINILDVRKESEYLSEHVENAENAPLDYINESMLKIDKDKTYFVHCAGGYRSMVFNSILRARGYDNLIDVKGGFKDIKESEKFKVSDYVCPTTLL